MMIEKSTLSTTIYFVQERARGLAERVLRNQPDSMQAMTLLGWIIVMQHQEEDADAGDDGELEEAMGHFDSALDGNPNNIEALMGKAKICELRHELPKALHIVTEVIWKALSDALK